MSNILTPQQFKQGFLQEVAPGDPTTPPEPVPIISPYKQVRAFTPHQDPTSLSWLVKYEQAYITPVAKATADLFGVSLLDDSLYAAGSEAEKASLLSVVTTRKGAQQIEPGVWGWFPLVVVASKLIIVMLEMHIDVSNNKVVWPKALLWSNVTEQYEPVVSPRTGNIPDPMVLPQHILPQFIKIEKLWDTP